MLRVMRMTVLLAVMAILGGCGGKVPCAICYEDEWSREPFPGQEKQHIPTVDTRTPEQKEGTSE